MDKFLEIYILPKFNQEERDNLNKPISRSEIESIIKKKNLCKLKSRTRRLHWGILPSIQSYPSQTIPK